MDLESIPGVGEKTARALSALDDPERALRAGDVEAIATARGSPGAGRPIARGAIRLEHDDPGGFLATDRAREVYREVLGLLEERTVTDYAARRLETFYPSPRRSRIAGGTGVRPRGARARPRPRGARRARGGRTPSRAGRRAGSRALSGDDRRRALLGGARGDSGTLRRNAPRDAQGWLNSPGVRDGDRPRRVLRRRHARGRRAGPARRPLENPAEVVPERPLAFFARNRDRLQAAVGPSGR